MNQLKQSGVINVNTVTTLIKNRIVLVSSVNNPLSSKISNQKDIYRIISDIINGSIPVTLLVIGDPLYVPLGKYTMNVLEKMGYDDDIKKFLLPTASSSKALYMIAKGNNIGFVYASDAFNNNEVKILAEVDESMHNPIIYWGAIVIDEQMENAIKFLEFLKTDTAKDIFIKYGFIVN